MADITAVLIKALRERTGIGMMECKKALCEAQGNIELAIDNMRKSGQVKAAKKASCITANGMILIKVTHNNKYGVMIELNCETDFVAHATCFKAFGEDVISAALNERISNLEALKSKFEEKRTALVTKVSENIRISQLGSLEGFVLGSYLHGSRIGVLVSADGINQAGLKHIAMHIAASKPAYLNVNDIPADMLAHERQIQLGIAMQFGKSCEIAEKIVTGRMRKFMREITLTTQDFVMDPSKNVSQILDEYGLNVNQFIRFEVGQGIEKN